jgi:hypothetical protein
MQRTGPKEYYADKIRRDIFSKIKPMWLERHLGIKYTTAYTWKKDPGKMPAWRYLQIIKQMEVEQDWTK